MGFRLTIQQARALNIDVDRYLAGDFPAHPPEAKPSKYHAVRTEYGGHTYDSKGEANHAAGLDARKDAGEIRGWIRQVTIELGAPEDTIRVDFLVFNLDGTVHVEEYKGARTQKWIKDIKKWRKHGPCDMYVYTSGKVDVIRCRHSPEEQP